MQHDRMRVHFHAFTVPERFASKSLQFLPRGQKRTLYMTRGEAF